MTAKAKDNVNVNVTYSLDLTDPFQATLAEMAEMHNAKGHDYGADEDQYANLRASEEIGIHPWIGCFIRMNDKAHRLKRFIQKGELKNESAADSLIDIAVYAVMARLFHKGEL